MIRVLVVDDQVLVRSGLVAILDAQDDVEVVGEAEDGGQAVERALVAAVRTVAAGEALLAPGMTRRLIERFAVPADRGDEAFAQLTERELEVVRLVVRGMSNAEIANEVAVSEATVKTHLTNVLRKLDLRDRTQLVVRAYKAGFVRPGSA
jgi:DNA-binding NarL/FixJ family response regulator